MGSKRLRKKGGKLLNGMDNLGQGGLCPVDAELKRHLKKRRQVVERKEARTFNGQRGEIHQQRRVGNKRLRKEGIGNAHVKLKASQHYETRLAKSH